MGVAIRDAAPPEPSEPAPPLSAAALVQDPVLGSHWVVDVVFLAPLEPVDTPPTAEPLLPVELLPLPDPALTPDLLTEPVDPPEEPVPTDVPLPVPVDELVAVLLLLLVEACAPPVPVLH